MIPVTTQKYLDQGSVTLVDVMGTDRRIADAAWVSTDKAQDRSLSDVERLLTYLAKHNHWTPFAHPQITLRFHIPLFIARQLMRSNVGIVWNEESRRYVDTTPTFYDPTSWRARSPSLKQGSLSTPPDNTNYISSCYRLQCEDSLRTYDELIALGLSPEMARLCLPVSTYTTLMGTFSLYALARVHNLRANPHAQLEIRDLAACISTIIKPLFPFAWPLLTETPNGQV
jgi:thymidylate synthase (FAD)